MTSRDAVAGPLRVTELLVPLSLAADLAMGAPDGQAAQACLLATGLGRRIGLPDSALADVYYTTLLKHLGCTATAHEEASHLGGDELAVRPLLSRTDDTRLPEVLSLLASIGGGSGLIARSRIVFGALAGARWGPGVQRAVCEVATLLAARIGMPETVQVALGQTFERWDGKGQPGKLRGEAIEFSARVAHVASRAIAFHAIGGARAALESVRQGRGGWFDPVVADALFEHGPALLTEIDATDTLDAALEQEPRPWRTVHTRDVEAIAAAFADMADLKSSFTVGHSPGVAALVYEAAPRLGLADGETAELKLAALLHDLGRVGVPSGAWERPQLRSADWERMRLHPYYTERILSRGRVFAGVASIAGLHHERLDGSGYYRGSRASQLPIAARLLAAADTYQAKTQERPHRAALPAEAAAELLLADARAGRLDPDAVVAVVEVVAHGRTTRIARETPAGLTEREIEVLRLIAKGCSNREIADRLVISPRTAEHHVQHIYEKIGLSTRAGAVMFALQYDLLTPPLHP